MGRTKLFDRAKVLEKAMFLFWEKGYHATGLSELEEEMGINKFSIYAEFESKRGLFLATLDFFTENYQKPAFLSVDPERPIDSIVEFFDRVLTMPSVVGRNGCYLLCAGIEFNQSDPEIQTRIQVLYQQLEDRLRHTLVRAQSLNLVSTIFSADEMSSFLRTYLEGLLSRQRHSNSASEMAKSNAFVRSIFQSSQKHS